MASPRTDLNENEEALIQQALAELKRAKPPLPTAAADQPFDPDKTIPVALLPESERPAWAPRPVEPPPEVPPQAPSAEAAQPGVPHVQMAGGAAADAKTTVFAPAGMSPEMQAKIALLMEQEAEAREKRRGRQRRSVAIAAVVGVLVILAIFIASIGTPGSKKPKAAASAAAAVVQLLGSRPIA